MTDAGALLENHRRVHQAFVRASDEANARFDAVIAEAEAVITGPDDQRPEAAAVRARVREALSLVCGVVPGSELYELKHELRASHHAMRALVLSRGTTPLTPA